MTCAEAEARLVDAVDGRLDAPLEAGLHAHRVGCASCRARAALWNGLVPGMRALVPDPPDAMQARRMQIEVERRLASPPALTGGARRWWPRLPAALALVGAAAVLVLWLRRPPARTVQAVPAYAVVLRAEGDLEAGGHRVTAAARLGEETELALVGAGRAELALGRGSVVRLTGPARVRLGGTRRDVALRLEAGTLEAEVAHRLAGETFAVMTRDLRVEVRGTRFSVGAGGTGSWLRVDEGRVETRFADGRSRMVSAGETVTSAGEPARQQDPPIEPAPGSSSAPESLPASGTGRVPAAPRSTTCAEAVRACQTTARAARESMRAGDQDRALELLTAADRARAEGRPGAFCAGGAGACEDELRYLRAEALRGSGRIDDAVLAYQALGRRGAPAAMRQNALYAAAQLEQRQGHAARASADYQRALAAAPRGALREEALVGAMESAATAGDEIRAQALARHYLEQFPSGLGGAAARRLVGGGRSP